jgi:hypothetical protein
MRTPVTLPSLLIALLLVGCGGTARPPSESTDPATQPIVGVWVGQHECEGIRDALTDAGFDTAAVLENIAGNGLVPGVSSPDELDPAEPCADAIVVEHSHEFTADGGFASFDGDGNEVDSGTWEPVDDDTIAIGASDVRFDYTINDGHLALDPQLQPGCLDFDCLWATMVAMSWSGMERDE